MCFANEIKRLEKRDTDEERGTEAVVESVRRAGQDFLFKYGIYFSFP